jgi:hypothetical protein
MKIYQLSFDYDFALADIVESLNGADSLDLSSDNPAMMKNFKYGWITTESEIIPDFVLIFLDLLGCKANISQIVCNLIPELEQHPIKIADDDYVLFSNIPTISDCLNLKKSKVTRFSTGEIMEISNPVFLPNNYPPLFKTEDMLTTYFCTQEFKDLLDNKSYTGLVLKECKIKSKSWF